MSNPRILGAFPLPRNASLISCSRSTARRQFSTTHTRYGSSFLNLQARSVARESGHFSKQSGVPYVHHSPALQLLSAERDLGEANAATKSQSRIAPDALSQPSNTSLEPKEKDIEDYKRYNDVLQSLLVSSRNEMDKRIAEEQQAYSTLDDRNIRTRFWFTLWILLTGFLVADIYALSDEVEQHCEGCFEGNAKAKLWLFGYMKAVSDSLSKARKVVKAPHVEDTDARHPGFGTLRDDISPVAEVRRPVSGMTSIPIEKQCLKASSDMQNKSASTSSRTRNTESWLSFLWAKPRNI